MPLHITRRPRSLCSPATIGHTTSEVSQAAGAFVCNAVFYGLMHQLAAGAAPLPHSERGEGTKVPQNVSTISQGVFLMPGEA